SALDFADQVSLAARVAREVPAAGALARRMHRVVLLDEFQDTSVAQLQMLTDLFGPGHAACAVGDPPQAIYGWRGASAPSPAALDFADQVSLAARVAREVPAAGALARRMHRVVLLDEFQDTSVAQLQMLTDLFGPGHAACAVGDPQQAIYGWRGASASSLAGFA